MKCYNSVALHISKKKTDIKGEIENNFHKNPNFHLTFFSLTNVVKNKLKLYSFGRDFMTNQLKLIVTKKCGFQS